jgi:hypothetical protein
MYIYKYKNNFFTLLPYVSVLESVREDFREKWQTVWARNEAYPKGISNATMSQRGSFCHFENRSVTDSRNETWKISKKAFGTFGFAKVRREKEPLVTKESM